MTLIIMLRLSVFICLTIFLSACSIFHNPDDNPEKWSAEKYYYMAKQAMDTGDFKLAVERFEGLISHHPFGPYAQQAQLDIAYGYYKYNEPESAIAAADQFIKLYPRHPHVDYAYYIKGLARFPKPAFLEKTFSLDLAQRDPRTVRESLQSFLELTQRYPNSRYAADAKQRIIYLRNALARGEMYTANFYMRTGAYAAAVNRAKYVIEHYDRTPSIPDALALMAKAYDRLGMPTLAEDARRVLKLNFPDRTQPKTSSR